MSEVLVSKFHPAVESAETLKTLFVGEERRGLVNDILKELKIENQKNAYLQGHLIYGPAGIGKTFLLWSLFHNLKEDNELSKIYLPVVLPEELFDAACMGDILLSTLKTIVEYPNRTNADDRIRKFLKESIKELRQEKDNFKRFKSTKSIFDEMKERFNKKTVIIIENLDKLIDTFDKKELNNLLEILPRSQSIKIIAASIAFLEALGDSAGPLYAYFRHHPLEPLTEAECVELISHLIEFYSGGGRSHLATYFNSPDGKRRIKIFQAISYLSGGLPRMLYPLFEIALAECGRVYNRDEANLRFTTSLKFMQEMFERLTVIYREMIWSLPLKEREILILLAAESSTLRPTDIALELRIDAREVSTYLSRLLKRKYIRNYTEVSKKEQFYSTSEPLLSLWWHWRQGAAEEEKWSFVVDLLAMLFEKEELEKVRERENLSPFMGKLYEMAMVRSADKTEEAVLSKPKYTQTISELNITHEVGFDVKEMGEESYSLLRKPLGLNPEFAEAWYNDGVVFAKLGKYKEALESLEEALRINPEFTIAWYNKGVALYKLGRCEEALKAYGEALRINPELANAWYNKGDVLYKLDRYEEALKAYVEALRINPEYVNLWYDKGVVLGGLDRSEEVLKAYEKVLIIDPKYWDNKGQALYNLGKYEEALEAFQEALGINPEYANAWNNKGVTLSNLGRYGEALKAYEEALKINPEDAIAWYNKGIGLFYLIRYRGAIASFQKSFSLSSSTTLLLKNLREDFAPQIEDGINHLLQEMGTKDIVLFHLVAVSFLVHLKENNTGYVKKRVGQIIKWNTALEEKNKIINETLFMLFEEEGFEEIINLGQITKEMNWTTFEGNPIFIAAQIAFHLKENNSAAALKILERLDSLQHAAVKKIVSLHFGSDWLKEARRKLFSSD